MENLLKEIDSFIKDKTTVDYDVDLSSLTIKVGGETYTVTIPDEPISTRVELVKEVTKLFQNGAIG